MIPVGFGVSFTTIGLNPMGVLVGPGMLRNRCGMGFVEGIGIFRMLGFRVCFLVAVGSPGSLHPAEGQARHARITNGNAEDRHCDVRCGLLLFAKKEKVA
jgi:hypothetical protein